MRFVQGIDYGPRDGTLGISFHMSEGGDELAGYLARHPGEDLHQWAARVSGVSCNAALLSSGEIVQMLAWNHASGNLNPNDRAGEYNFYGGHHLREVLGAHWPDPNTWLVSMEIAGRRANGPTDAQVTAAIKWGRDMMALFPTIRGTVGHHDQSPKPCPGVTANMKAIFAGLGGHGLWTAQEEPMIPISNISAPGPYNVALKVNVQLYDQSFKPLVKVSQPQTAEGLFVTGSGYVGIEVVTGGQRQLAFAKIADVTLTAKPAPPAADCTAAVAAAVGPLNAALALEQSRVASIKGKTATFAADIAND